MTETFKRGDKVCMKCHIAGGPHATVTSVNDNYVTIEWPPEGKRTTPWWETIHSKYIAKIPYQRTLEFGIHRGCMNNEDKSMMSFKEFIFEVVKRDTKRAVELGLNLAKRHQKYSNVPAIKAGGAIEFRGYDPKDRELSHSLATLRFHGDKAIVKNLPPIRRIAFKDIIPTQSGTEFKPHLAYWKMEDDEPAYVLKHKGKHYMLNGHHRMIAKKLKGETHINAHVFDEDE